MDKPNLREWHMIWEVIEEEKERSCGVEGEVEWRDLQKRKYLLYGPILHAIAEERRRTRHEEVLSSFLQLL